MGSRRLYPRPDTAICGIFQISFYDNLFNPNKNSKIQNKTKLNKKTIEILLNKLFVLDDQQQNEKLINEYANEHDITVIFDNNIVTQSLTQKHLGMFLDTKLDFQEHLKSIFSKVNKAIGLLLKLHHILPRSSLLTIYKSFIRPHLDYGDIIYDEA